MTTSIHVVNFGPDTVEVDQGSLYGRPPVKIYPRQSSDFYVFDGQDALIKELKPVKTGND